MDLNLFQSGGLEQTLFRSIDVTSKKNNNFLLSDKLKDMYELIDEFQKVIDKNKLSSEVHIVFKRK